MHNTPKAKVSALVTDNIKIDKYFDLLPADFKILKDLLTFLGIGNPFERSVGSREIAFVSVLC